MALTAPLLRDSPGGADADVLIVGAGPVGLLAACELAARGCSVRVVDVNPEPVKLTKASGIAARSLEVLPKAVVDDIMQYSKFVQGVKLHESAQGNAQMIGEVSLQGIPVYHGIRSQEQWRTEEALRRHLETLPNVQGIRMQVERSTELVDFSETADGVECELKRHGPGGGTAKVKAKFLLGCDGGRSPIRKKLGFSFEGEATAEYFFALHANFENYTGDEHAMDVFFSKAADPMAAGFAFSMPMPDGGFLIVVDLDESQQSQWKTSETSHGQPVLRQPSADDVCRVLESRGCGISGKSMKVIPGSVKWIAHFRVQSRQAEHYGKGRVFLAGDACHCHSPLGGQGMNMGFQDAKNIAWKLAMVARGASPLSLLSTYEEERRAIERRILVAVERAQKAVSSRNPVIFFMRGRGQRFAPVLLNYLTAPLGYMSQQAWSYYKCALSHEHWERPVPSFASLCPLGGFRREQNFQRWLGTRVRAGDTVPNIAVRLGGSEMLLDRLRQTRGFTLLFFEGQMESNGKMERFCRNVQILTYTELEKLGEELRSDPEKSGFVAGIDHVVVIPAADTVSHRAFGVFGQCLYLIRPDMHVGLRSQPVRAAVVRRYLRDSFGFPQAAGDCVAPPAAAFFDFLPFGIWACISVCCVGALGLVEGPGAWLKGLTGFSLTILCFLLTISTPPRGPME